MCGPNEHHNCLSNFACCQLAYISLVCHHGAQIKKNEDQPSKSFLDGQASTYLTVFNLLQRTKPSMKIAESPLYVSILPSVPSVL